MARWLVKLEGEQIDLEEFPRHFPDGDVHAAEESDGVYITGDALLAHSDPSHVREAAAEALDQFVAVISLIWPPLQRPTLGFVVREDDDGKRINHYSIAAGSGRIRVKFRGVGAALGPDGLPLPPPRFTQAQQLLALSRQSPRLHVSLLLWADPLKTWARLYRVLEEVELHLGKLANKAGLCTKNDRVRFRQSANSAEVAGKDSRHASGEQPPPVPMKLDDAVSFVGKVLHGALAREASATPSEEKI